MITHPIYSYSLCIALPLMLFFGFYFIFAPVPDKAIFGNYLRSRRVMGFAVLLLAANYSVHFFAEIRFRNVDAAILINLSTYFLCYWLFSSALTTLLDRFYITRRRFVVHVCQWLLFTALSGVVLLGLPKGLIQEMGILVMCVWLVAYGLVLARRLILSYRRAVRLCDDTHSDDVGAYIRWLSIFTYWAVIFGVGCGLLTFLPDAYVYIWILSSLPFYIYLYCSYMNYLLFYEQVEQVFELEMSSEGDTSAIATGETQTLPPCFAEIAERLSVWIEGKGYLKLGLTLKELSEILKTNRTYLSSYIKQVYQLSFREWISSLRLEYSKTMLKECPDLTIAEIAEKSGFQSASHFIRLFKEKENCSPARWRKKQVK